MLHIQNCCIVYHEKKKIKKGLLQEKNPQGSSRKVSLTFTLQETYTEFEILVKHFQQK